MAKSKQLIKKIAKARIIFLFQEAHKIFPEKPELSNKYIALARIYSQRAKVAIPDEWRNRICHKCKKFLYPGLNYRVRMQSRKGKGSHVSLTCLECNNTTRYFINTIKNDYK